jgi:hypothetical protein
MQSLRSGREPRRGRASRRAIDPPVPRRDIASTHQPPRRGGVESTCPPSASARAPSLSHGSRVSIEASKTECTGTEPNASWSGIPSLLPQSDVPYARWRKRTEAIRISTQEYVSCEKDGSVRLGAGTELAMQATCETRVAERSDLEVSQPSTVLSQVRCPRRSLSTSCPHAACARLRQGSYSPMINALFAAEKAASDPLSDPAELHLTNMAIHCCAEETDEIYETLHELESRRRPRLDYIEAIQEPHINARMRAILVDWLAEVASEFQLSTETLHLSVCYLDRYLSLQPVSREVLQLVGMTCMLVAAKVEEITVPLLDDFVFISAETYSRAQVKVMETQLLQGLNFELCDVTALPFWRRYAGLAGLDREHASLALFLCELALVDYPLCVRILPSFRAAAAVWIASRMSWPESLSQALHGIQDPRQSSEMQFAAARMIKLWQKALTADRLEIDPVPNDALQLRSIVEKYGSEAWCTVARTPPADVAFMLSENPFGR